MLSDNEVYAGMLAKLGDEELNVTSYDETNVKGEIDALSDGTLFITMPYSEGWTAKVDGEEREIKGDRGLLGGVGRIRRDLQGNQSAHHSVGFAGDAQ